jgi:SAM-dependent methyltransferase
MPINADLGYRPRMAFGERWLTALSPFVRAQLPTAPVRVLELGCGPLGGFVPVLLADGYDAVGVDRNAPAGAEYRQDDFERHALSAPVDVVIASRSLHHVGDVEEVLDHVAASLRPGGRVIVAEWEWERFDERTARWCFERLGASEGDDPGWLRRRHAGWLASGDGWDAYFAAWANGHGLQPAERILDALDRRFECALCERGPYFYADLEGVAEQDEQAAIEAGEISATGIRYVGALRA